MKGKFCCRGCEQVYHLLLDRGLGAYYQIRERGASIRKSRPAPLSSQASSTYAYLDDPEFLKLYTASSDGQVTMQFYLEGVHCTACIWLTEKVKDWVDGVLSVRLDLGHSLATVRIAPNGSFSKVAQEFMRLGYRPHPVKRDEAMKLQEKENHRALIRMAIAGAAAGNIMLLAISIYGGATGVIAERFEWISFFICLPVATYSAWPFYRSAWSAIRSRQLSIDIPIALGLGVGFIASVISLLIHSRYIYFDTVATLVFLLLASRYVLRKTQQEALHATRLVHFLTPSMVRKKVDNAEGFEEIKADQVKVGERVLVLAGECIPVDGVIRSGISNLNCSLLTGESKLELVQPGSHVFAGTLNTQAPLEIEVQAQPSATRLGRILQSMEEHLSRKAPIVAFTDSVARVFVLASLLLVGVAFLVGLRVSAGEAVSRALAMAIVACPCAFAFATPLALSVTMGRCAKNGILIKSPDVIEKLSQVDRVILDKTGTLTTGEFEVLSWITDADTSGIEEAVLALESRSPHPIARALTRYLRNRHEPVRDVQVEEFQERIGEGVSGRIEGHRFEIRRQPISQAAEDGRSRPGSHIAIFRDGKVVGRAALGDALREDSKEAVSILRKMGLKPEILSGDSRSAVQFVAHELGIPASFARAQASPEEKSRIIERSPRALMVGDGANDAVALATAYVGVAVHSGMEISMQAADIYHCLPGVMPLVQLMTVSRETLKVIYRNFAFSIVYNLIGAAAAISGRVDPLFAAILMPISALTVFSSSIYGTRKLRKVFAEVRS